MIGKMLCSLWISLAILSTGFAQEQTTREPVLTAEQYARIEAEGFLRTEDGSFSLCPDTPLSRKAIATWEKKEKPVYAAENLYRVKKSTLVENSQQAADNADSFPVDTSLQAVSRVVRSVSKMQGMRYYSNNDKKWAVLYEEAYLTDEKRKRIEDQTDGNADGLTLHCLLKDHTFGKGFYRLDYQQTEKEVSLCMTNDAALKVMGITGVKPGYMKINLVVIDDDDSYIVYMVVQAKYPSISFLENMLRRSFYARLDAIYNWFIKQF